MNGGIINMSLPILQRKRGKNGVTPSDDIHHWPKCSGYEMLKGLRRHGFCPFRSFTFSILLKCLETVVTCFLEHHNAKN